MPELPDRDDGESLRQPYPIYTGTANLVAKYANMTIPQVMRLDLIDYMILRRDAFIYSRSRTKEGIEALSEAWAREQTEPDRKSLRQMLGRR